MDHDDALDQTCRFHRRTQHMIPAAEDTRDSRLRFALKMALASRRWRACVDALNLATGNDRNSLIPLYQLAARPSGLTQVELANRMSIVESSAARMVSVLLRKGLVTRCRMPGDRRAWLVKLTPAGQDAIARYEPRAKALRERLLDGVPEEDLAAANRVLTHLVERITEELDAERF
ncbi:MarR family winged helix-turn-helix transcriptional regulator [Brevundimonas sp.]|uniref:MarR family winged helix-turn-helix transcriptional regulator n=1 Tax=Brevundimonas sp. TaxID=1871086 RepID=UPI0037BE4D49